MHDLGQNKSVWGYSVSCMWRVGIHATGLVDDKYKKGIQSHIICQHSFPSLTHLSLQDSITNTYQLPRCGCKYL